MLKLLETWPTGRPMPFGVYSCSGIAVCCVNNGLHWNVRLVLISVGRPAYAPLQVGGGPT